MQVAAYTSLHHAAHLSRYHSAHGGLQPYPLWWAWYPLTRPVIGQWARRRDGSCTVSLPRVEMRGESAWQRTDGIPSSPVPDTPREAWSGEGADYTHTHTHTHTHPPPPGVAPYGQTNAPHLPVKEGPHLDVPAATDGSPKKRVNTPPNAAGKENRPTSK